MEHSFRLLIRSSTPGLKARSFDSNDTDCYHFVHREHVETSSYVCFSSQADSLARCCYGTLDAVRNEAGVQTLAISETLFIQAVQIILQAHICIKIWTKYHDDTGQYNWELENAITPGDTAGIGVPEPPSIAVIDVTPLNNSTMLGLCFSSFPISVYEFEDTNIPSLLERYVYRALFY